jgi:hypothetical protein
MTPINNLKPRKPGAKPKREEAAITTSIRLTPARREKLRRLGGADWLSPLIDAAPEPK